MRRILRLTGWLLGVLAGLILLVMAAVAGLVWVTLPGGNRTVAIPGLSAPVDITLDDDGVPRVRAANESDAAAALGFLHARERLFQMDMTRRAAAGELSEVLGAVTLPSDRLMRVLGVHARAQADFAALPAETRGLLEAYARGVNAWIDARGRFSAIEYVALGRPREWSPVDSLLWGKLMGLYLSSNWRTELARMALVGKMPDAEVDGLWPSTGGAGHPEARLDPALAATAGKLAEVLPKFPDPFTLPQTASNEWAVDGRHTETGAPLLAGDPHLAFSLPGVWYLARIETPGRVLAGATAPGVPFMVLGHNGRIAWTFTTTGADVQDLFVETPAGDGNYLTPDGPRPFVLRTEVIHVRGGADETLAGRETRHGPVISDLVAPRGPMLSVSMANLAAGDTTRVRTARAQPRRRCRGGRPGRGGDDLAGAEPAGGGSGADCAVRNRPGAGAPRRRRLAAGAGCGWWVRLGWLGVGRAVAARDRAGERAAGERQRADRAGGFSRVPRPRLVR